MEMNRMTFSDKDSGSDATDSPAETQDASIKPYHMTPSEIASLRQAAKSDAAAMAKILAEYPKS